MNIEPGSSSIPNPEDVIFAVGTGEMDVDVHRGHRLSSVSEHGPLVAVFQGSQLLPISEREGVRLAIVAIDDDRATIATLNVIDAKLMPSSTDGFMSFEGTLVAAELGSAEAQSSGFTAANLGRLPMPVTIRFKPRVSG